MVSVLPRLNILTAAVRTVYWSSILQQIVLISFDRPQEDCTLVPSVAGFKQVEAIGGGRKIRRIGDEMARLERIKFVKIEDKQKKSSAVFLE